MIAYTMVGTRDLEKALTFYDPLFAEMGWDVCWKDEACVSYGKESDLDFPRFFVGYPFDGQAAGVGNGTMTAFQFAAPEQVDRLYEIAIRNGGSDEGAPGYRPQYGEGFYAAYVRDRDGNKLAFVVYPREADEGK
ncbi:VOC family protein [Halomonas daqingensis]|uniref:VOC family protein n=1 Tax=Billgrantia desiderata TaxID=52021 RepID=A0AAW4YQS2_9GAMM|nr:VOC family protein [Halomonas desiderata]MCE8042925.1 VOC family protein [Halomonas desiderata]MCE8047559.1 VOC family protein [Halomonas desiderata]MCE8050326.1 VOC family protein [Halomonas desiderata]OUE38164.1 glyoxalase [Halomonas desiderata SP1]SEF75618.1 Glyoxalase-like domain-containing protein [Halomonas desiderata]